jgi:hypothetical protein
MELPIVVKYFDKLNVTRNKEPINPQQMKCPHINVEV